MLMDGGGKREHNDGEGGIPPSPTTHARHLSVCFISSLIGLLYQYLSLKSRSN